MRAQVLAVATGCGVIAAALSLQSHATGSTQERVRATRITWADVTPLQSRLEARGLTAAAFPSHVAQLREAHARRVRDGDLDHLIFYLLQSKGFTSLPSIEPALSAKSLVDGLDGKERDAFLRGGDADPSRMSSAARSRLVTFLKALDAPARDTRLLYFGELVKATYPNAAARESGLVREYFRVMRFVYQKEFVAQRSERPAEAVAALYRSRGLSTDTAVEAGYLVSIGLGILKSLEPDRRIRRVLIVGPGLDLAPRTALLEAGPPESYQPWAVMDALVSHGLARLEELTVVAADINPRVVSHLRRARDRPPALTLVSEIPDSDAVTLSAEYRDYFAGLGRAIAVAHVPPVSGRGSGGHLRSTLRVNPAAARALDAESLDIVTDRLEGLTFDLVVATNILPYFDDGELMLAMANVAGMLAPGGVFLHNEARASLHDITTALGFPAEQSRHAVIATVRGAPPLADSVWLHRKIIRGAPPLGLPYWLAREAPTPRSARHAHSLRSFAVSLGSYGR